MPRKTVKHPACMIAASGLCKERIQTGKTQAVNCYGAEIKKQSRFFSSKSSTFLYGKYTTIRVMFRATMQGFPAIKTIKLFPRRFQTARLLCPHP